MGEFKCWPTIFHRALAAFRLLTVYAREHKPSSFDLCVDKRSVCRTFAILAMHKKSKLIPRVCCVAHKRLSTRTYKGHRALTVFLLHTFIVSPAHATNFSPSHPHSCVPSATATHARLSILLSITAQHRALLALEMFWISAPFFRSQCVPDETSLILTFF